MFALLSSVNKSRNAPLKLLLELFDKMIMPILLYNIVKFGEHSYFPTNIFSIMQQRVHFRLNC